MAIVANVFDRSIEHAVKMAPVSGREGRYRAVGVAAQKLAVLQKTWYGNHGRNHAGTVGRSNARISRSTR